MPRLHFLKRSGIVFFRAVRRRKNILCMKPNDLFCHKKGKDSRNPTSCQDVISVLTEPSSWIGGASALYVAKGYHTDIEPKDVLLAQYLAQRRFCLTILKRSLDDVLTIMLHEGHGVVPSIVSSYGPDAHCVTRDLTHG